MERKVMAPKTVSKPELSVCGLDVIFGAGTDMSAILAAAKRWRDTGERRRRHDEHRERLTKRC